MRRIIFISSLMALLAFPAWAQVEISGGLGYYSPFNNTKDTHLGGYTIGGNIGYFLSDQFCFGVEIYYHELALSSKQEDQIAEEGIEVSKSMSSLVPTAKFLLTTGKTAVYAKFVAGSFEYKETIHEDDITRTASKRLIGVGGGLGIQYQSAGFFGGFVEAIYNHITPTEEMTLDYGDFWDFTSFRAGIILKGY